ncbi:PTS glucose transporter subunit IIA [Oceanobacillus piezotolerans]|uniref:PTS glucose transporter subunit IIA n=1 Tax=Oceanobacillus piezotolerans TaxID=2448030 RepID=A0A498D7M0_9BACI|nr:PTS glucose transporter subunit IIA [Oceanobacillus piezotolerans]RLL41797.1 PTS glucose transporter subunit IIA [Oceanobacillus piezotolerans]
MLKDLFKKKEEVKNITLVAPVSGELVSLEKVPDPVFAEKMMGDGVAIEPENGDIVSPVDGKIVQLFPTKHAIGIQAENGAEILLHIGLDTVNLNGEGFTAHVEEGKKVKQGDSLLSVDLDVIREKATGTIIPIIITNSDAMSSIKTKDVKEVTAGNDEILIVEK